MMKILLLAGLLLLTGCQEDMSPEAFWTDHGVYESYWGNLREVIYGTIILGVLTGVIPLVMIVGAIELVVFTVKRVKKILNKDYRRISKADRREILLKQLEQEALRQEAEKEFQRKLESYG